MKITLYGGIGEIGGNKILVESTDHTQIFLDFGRRLNFTGKFYQEYIKPRSKNILRDFLKLGVIPHLSNIYRPELLSVDFSQIPSESYKYLPPLDEAPDYWNYSKLLDKTSKKLNLSGIFISHAHFDHIQDVCFIDPKIPIFCSEKTKILAETILDLSQTSIENEFFYYNKYILSVKQPYYRTAFPYSLEIKKEGTSKTERVIFQNPELTIDLNDPPLQRSFITMKEGRPININSMEITALPVDHSIPGAISLLVKDMKSQKSLLYSGDFRFGGPSSSELKSYIEKIKESADTLDAFICEGTRIASTEPKTEKEIENNLVEKMQPIKNLILIDFNWKDLGRLQTILNASKRVNRVLLIPPKVAYLLYHFHQTYPNEFVNPLAEKSLRVYIKRQGDLIYSPNIKKKTELGIFRHWGATNRQSDKSIVRIIHLIDLLEEKEKYISELSPNYLKALRELIPSWFGDIEEKELLKNLKLFKSLALCHFQKGIKAFEVRKSPEKYILMLSFWDVNELFDLSPENGDMSGSHFIKACTEPFNDEMLIDEQKMMNWLDQFNISYDFQYENPTQNKGKKVFLREHVSGHATGPEIKEIISQLAPKKVIPIHTINIEKFLEIGEEVGTEIIIPEEGKPIDI